MVTVKTKYKVQDFIPFYGIFNYSKRVEQNGATTETRIRGGMLMLYHATVIAIAGDSLITGLEKLLQ